MVAQRDLPVSVQVFLCQSAASPSPLWHGVGLVEEDVLTDAVAGKDVVESKGASVEVFLKLLCIKRDE